MQVVEGIKSNLKENEIQVLAAFFFGKFGDWWVVHCATPGPMVYLNECVLD